MEFNNSLSNPIYCGQGYLDEILTIFEKHNHPFIIVDNLAMRWMGCKNLAQLVSVLFRLSFDRYKLIMAQDVDVLVRRSQLSDIVSDILPTGNWYEEKPEEREKMGDYPYTDGETVLRAAPSHHSLYRCLRLWAEDLYFLSVDGPKIEIPDISAWQTTIVEQRYHPEIKERMYGPKHVGVHEPGILPPPEYQAKSPDMKVSIFIPTIARYLEARLQQDKQPRSLRTRRGITSSFDIRNLFRYVFLDLPHQQKKILPELSDVGRKYMIHKIQTYKRKFTYKIDESTMKFIKIIPWETGEQGGPSDS